MMNLACKRKEIEDLQKAYDIKKNENCQEIEPSIQAGGACRSSAEKHPSKTQTKACSRIEEEEIDAKKSAHIL